LNLASPFPDGSRVVDVMNASPMEFVMVPMESLGFPSFARDASVRAIHVGSDARPVYVVRDGKISIVLLKKSAAILVRR
jgi:hypothetical protein